MRNESCGVHGHRLVGDKDDWLRARQPHRRVSIAERFREAIARGGQGHLLPMYDPNFLDEART